MTLSIEIKQATSGQSAAIAEMVGELLEEIMNGIGEKAFNFDLDETRERLRRFLLDQRYFVFVAEDAGREVGFIALYESYIVGPMIWTTGIDRMPRNQKRKNRRGKKEF